MPKILLRNQRYIKQRMQYSPRYYSSSASVDFDDKHKFKNKYINYFSNNIGGIVSVVTGISLSLSFIFNLGFFLPIGIEYLNFLSIRDYLEGTLPSLLLFTGSSILLLISYLSDDISKYATTLKEYILSASKVKLIVLRYLVFYPLVLTIWIIEFIGRLGFLYYILILQLVGLFSAASTTHYQFHKYLIFSLILFFVIIIFDLFLQSRSKDVKFRVYVLRTILLSTYITFTAGLSNFYKTLEKNTQWTIYTKENNILDNTIFLRALDKGILVYNVNDITVNVIRWEYVYKLTKEFNSNSESKGSVSIDSL